MTDEIFYAGISEEGARRLAEGGVEALLDGKSGLTGFQDMRHATLFDERGFDRTPSYLLRVRLITNTPPADRGDLDKVAMEHFGIEDPDRVSDAFDGGEASGWLMDKDDYRAAVEKAGFDCFLDWMIMGNYEKRALVAWKPSTVRILPPTVGTIEIMETDKGTELKVGGTVALSRGLQASNAVYAARTGHEDVQILADGQAAVAAISAVEGWSAEGIMRPNSYLVSARAPDGSAYDLTVRKSSSDISPMDRWLEGKGVTAYSLGLGPWSNAPGPKR